MRSAPRHSQIIDKLRLRGTLLERLIREPEGWANPDAFEDSPNVMRYAMDLKRALEFEGWNAPEPIPVPVRRRR